MKVKIGLKSVACLAIAWLLAGCSKDTADVLPVPEPVVPGPVDPEQEEQYLDAPVWMVGVKRAPLGTSHQGDIRVLLNNSGTTVSGLFKYENDNWLTQLKLKSGTCTYRLYGYMPDDAQETSSLTSVTADNAVLRLQGLSPITAKDYCIVTGVCQATSATDETTATRGNFSFEYASNRQNYINLLLDHLQSRVVFRMQVGTEYDNVRTIKIKRMSLSIADVGSLSANVTLTNGVGISSVAYGIGSGTGDHTLTIKEEEQTLTITPAEVCSAYVIPDATLLGKLYLVTKYDVYDQQGNKVAERTAINKLTTALDELQRGEERTLTVTVAPSYLYVLSDGDLNDPPLVVD